jgi:hypothetical protein
MARTIDPNNPTAQFVPVASPEDAKVLETILREKFSLAAQVCLPTDSQPLHSVCVYNPWRVKSFTPATEDEFFDTLARFDPTPWERLEVEGGTVEKQTERYAARYRVDVFQHPAFEGYTVAEVKHLVAAWGGLKDGSKLTASGCAAWTSEQFLHRLKVELNLSRSWKAVLAEDNFITRALAPASPSEGEPVPETFAEKCDAICHKLEFDWDRLHDLFSPVPLVSGDAEAVLADRFNLDMKTHSAIVPALVAAGILTDDEAEVLYEEFGATRA